MIDLNQFASVAGLAVLVGLAVQAIKGYVHRSAVPWLAVAVGVLLALLVGYGNGQLTELAQVPSWLIGGALAGLTATGLYESTVDKLKG